MLCRPSPPILSCHHHHCPRLPSTHRCLRRHRKAAAVCSSISQRRRSMTPRPEPTRPSTATSCGTTSPTSSSCNHGIACPSSCTPHRRHPQHSSSPCSMLTSTASADWSTSCQVAPSSSGASCAPPASTPCSRSKAGWRSATATATNATRCATRKNWLGRTNGRSRRSIWRIAISVRWTIKPKSPATKLLSTAPAKGSLLPTPKAERTRTQTTRRSPAIRLTASSSTNPKRMAARLHHRNADPFFVIETRSNDAHATNFET
mmetsp:Transcript_21266/g.60710  ORF Transcript_21266/g.60710 Transcript_21266/m.60710 type:complete len:261 (-) Transcript_21266:39-821(-)